MGFDFDPDCRKLRNSTTGHIEVVREISGYTVCRIERVPFYQIPSSGHREREGEREMKRIRERKRGRKEMSNLPVKVRSVWRKTVTEVSKKLPWACRRQHF